MAFELNPHEPISDGIRRVVREQIEETVAQLIDPDVDRNTAVHDARKMCKRVRAVLRFVRHDLGYDIYNRENERFRHASRLLSAARDSAVMVEALDALYTEDEGSEETAVVNLPPELMPLRDALTQRHETIAQQLLHEGENVNQFIQAMRHALTHLSDWPLQESSFDTIAHGLWRVYRRGRRQMRRAYTLRTAETFHDWRKRVKYLWHQLELLTPSDPDVLIPLAEDLHTLSSYLGDEHDLAELHHLLNDKPDLLPNTAVRQDLLDHIDTRRRELQLLAHSLGARLYEDKPSAFVKARQQQWKP